MAINDQLPNRSPVWSNEVWPLSEISTVLVEIVSDLKAVGRRIDDRRLKENGRGKDR